jgi:hypothetical protein
VQLATEFGECRQGAVAESLQHEVGEQAVGDYAEVILERA